MSLRQMEEVGADKVKRVGCWGEFGGEEEVEGDCGKDGVCEGFGKVEVVSLVLSVQKVLATGLCVV